MRRLITIAGSLVLAGCGSEPMSAEEVLGQADALERPAPGLYRTEAKLLSFEMPGIAPADADRFRNRMAGLAAQPQQQCLTPEEAEQGFELLRTIGDDVNGLTCAFEDFATDPRRWTRSWRVRAAAWKRASVSTAPPMRTDWTWRWRWTQARRSSSASRCNWYSTYRPSAWANVP